ncbi:Sporulation related domain-containing protein [Moraxella cuniculi DSM 21768]|uniref:Sporulation related domain-containing protein n=2 Tax=Moraxella cuniculi TaxID=34061 RepID=A0A1N7E6D7_9GAMM|nr:Sporulation related domain-containing protein [Moraxella cuniculi DSM 21768]
MLGMALIVGGGLAVFALTKNDSTSTDTQTTSDALAQSKVAKPTVQPLTADVATEEKLLSQKQRAREAHTLQMQQQAAALLEEQNNARKKALDKANAELSGRNPTTNQQLSADSAAKSELIAAPTIQTRPEAIEAARKAEEAKKAAEAAKQAAETAKKSEQQAQTTKTKDKQQDKAVKSEKTEQAQKKPDNKPANIKVVGNYEVKAGETWQGIANRHGVSVSALVQANGMTANDILRAGSSIKIPAATKNQQKSQDNKRSEQTKPAAQTQQKKAEKPTEKTAEKNTDNKAQSEQKQSENKQNPKLSGRYTVQVAISPDKQKIDEVVKQYRDAGYRVTTSNTSRGLRVLVGNEKTEEGAKALRNKLANDSRVNSSGAFVHQVQ